MSDDVIGGAIIEMGVETSGVDAGIDRMDAGFQRTGRSLATLGTQGTAALDRIGTASTSAASRLDNTTRNLAGSIERATAALEVGKKSGSDYLESLGRLRGADMDVLGPLIARFRELEQVQSAAAQSAIDAAKAEAQAQREAAQAMAGRESFLNGLRDQVTLTREQVTLFGRSADEALRYRAALAGVSAEAEPLIADLREQRTAHEQLAAAARAEAQAQRDAAQVQTNRDSFIASLEQQSSAIGRTRSELLELQAAQLGVSDQAAPFITRLRDAESGLNRTGMSAAQTANALRSVAPQFTDIFVSLQSGQPALQVFLQQGGQLRDMFGGAVPAARALGGYILSLVNPFTLAATAVGALAVAYYQGSKEGDAFARSIILTGNAAGTTTGQLTEMARQVSKTAGTQGEAAAVLASLVGSGKIGVDNLQRFATVAVKAQKDIGIAAADTAKDFADLAKSPLQATEKLNEKYGYLTGAIYAQIKALQDQGRTEAAAEVAQKAYADALENRSGKMKERLGVVEKAWAGITGTAKGAWDAMLGVGREETPEQEVEKLLARIAKARKPLPVVDKRDIGSVLLGQQIERFSGSQEAAPMLSADEKRVEVLQAQIDKRNRLAAIDADRRKFDEADTEWQRTTLQFLSREEQLRNELTAVREKGLAAGMSEKAITTAQGEVRKKYADIYNDALDAQIAKLQQRAAIEDEMDKRARLSVAASRATGLSSSYDLDMEYARKSEEMDQAQLARQKQRIEAELALVKRKQDSKKEQAALQGQLDLVDQKSLTRKAELEKQLSDIDTKATRDAANNLADLTGNRQDELVALQAQLQAQQDQNSLIGASQQQINAFNLSLVEERARRIENQAAIIGQNEARKDEAEAMLASAKAMRSLAQSQADGLIKTAQFEQQKQMWQSIDQTAHDTFVNIFMDGKSAFDRLRDTLKSGLLDLLYQMTVKKWIFNIGAEVSGYAGIANLAGAAAGGAGGSTGAAGTLSNAASLFSIGKTIYTGFSSGIASSLGSSIGSLGSLFGSEAVSAFGAGLQGGALGASTASAASGYAGTTAAGFGASAASAIPIIGWIIAGMSAANGFAKQGFTPNNGTITNPLAQAFTLPTNFVDKSLGWLGMGSTLTNILSGAAINTKLFGRANPVVESQGLRGTIDINGVDADSYAKILEKGGIFRSSKRYEKSVDLDSTVDATYDTTIKSMVEAVRGFAKAMGLQADQINTYTKSFDITLTGDSEKDGEAVAKLFGEVGDELSTKLLPSLATYKAENETLSATLQRLAVDYVSVDNLLATIGLTVKSVGEAGITAREGLIAAAGGLDALTSGTAYFAQNFLSPAEQMAPIVASVKKQLAELGVAGVNTNDQFKALVMGLDLSTEAGAKQYAELLKIAPQFKQVTDYMGSLDAAMVQSADALRERAELQNQYDQATLTQAQLLAQERAALDPTNRDLFDKVQAAKAAQEAASAFIDRANSAASVGMQSFNDALLETKRSAEAAVKSLAEYSKSLAIGDLSPLDSEERYQEAKKQLLSSALGDTDAATAFLNASRDRDAGDFSYSRDYALVQQRIAAATAAAQRTAASSSPDRWAQLFQANRDYLAPISSNPGQVLAAQPPAAPADAVATEDALQKLADKIVTALAPIATSTEKAAFVLDQVTEGGTGMLVVNP